MRFVDSHVHLSEYRDPGTVVGFAKGTATTLLTCGVDRDSSGRSLRLAESHPDTVIAFVGVHPSEAEKETDLEWIPKAIMEGAGLGEVGLDPKYSTTAPGGAQFRAFEAQLEAARGSGKPVQVHSRGAEQEVLDVLGGFEMGNVLMHWFQSRELLPKVSSLGYFVSFGPSVIYSKRLQNMARSYERSRVLSESDGPVEFEALGAARGPALVPSVVFKLAEVWGVPFFEATEILSRNALDYLGIPRKG